MSRQPGSQRDDDAESSSGLLPPNDAQFTDNGSTTPLLWKSANTALQALQRLEPVPSPFSRPARLNYAAQSLQRLANKNLALKTRKNGPKEPPPISNSRDAKVDFMGYERASKTVVDYVFIADELRWKKRIREPGLVTLREKVWDWIDWLWMRRRNCKICIKVIRALRTETASRAEWESGREICKVRELLPSVGSCGLCAVLYGGLSPVEQKIVDSHREGCAMSCLTTFVCTTIWRGGEVEVSLRLKHMMGMHPLEIEVKLLRRSGKFLPSLFLAKIFTRCRFQTF